MIAQTKINQISTLMRQRLNEAVSDEALLNQLVSALYKTGALDVLDCAKILEKGLLKTIEILEQNGSMVPDDVKSLLEDYITLVDGGLIKRTV